MICPKCQAINDDENVFCVSCGTTISQIVSGGVDSGIAGQPVPPTVQYLNSQQFSEQSQNPSTETAVLSVNQNQRSMPGFNPGVPYPAEPQVVSSNNKFIWIGFFAVLFLLLIGGGAFLISRQYQVAEALPDHFGMFFQNKAKDRVEEVKKQDFTNALEGKDTLLNGDSLPVVDGDPNLILYSDGKDIPHTDLRLIQLDTISDDGSLKQLDFEVAPVEGKPEMKRIRVRDGIANGKYAFALLDGFLNEGKHKFWAFQVKNAEKSDNKDALKAATVALKPTPVPVAKPNNQPSSVPQQTVPPPPAGQIAYSKTGRLVLRSGPSQNSPKIRNLAQGERVYIIEYSSNYESFKNLYSNFAYVQTENGQRGWAYAAYLR